MLTDADKPVTVKNADAASGGGPAVRTVLVASLIAAILLMIAIAALTTH